MYDYVIAVVAEEVDVRELERHPPPDLRDSEFIVVSESGWRGAAGNGLGTLFALENASEKAGSDIIEDVNRGKSVLIVHTAGEGTRNLLTRACRCKAFINVPSGDGSMRILDGVISQFQPFSVPSRIFVVWGDQFLFIEDPPEDVKRSALSTHVMLFGLKMDITEDTVRKYGIQIVKKQGVHHETDMCSQHSTHSTHSTASNAGEARLCEMIDFDDSRDFNVVRRKIERVEHGEALVNMGIFMLSGKMASCMRDVFGDALKRREGKFNSDELWQILVSRSTDELWQILVSRSKSAHESSHQTLHPSVGSGNSWLNKRAEALCRCMRDAAEDVQMLIGSFPLSDRTIWLDFGTNRSYYESLMLLIERKKLRDFLGVNLISGVLSVERDATFSTSSSGGCDICEGGVGIERGESGGSNSGCSSGGGSSGGSDGSGGGEGVFVEESVLVNSDIRSGSLVRSVVSNTEASHANLKRSCVLNALLKEVLAEGSVIYGVVDHDAMRASGSVVADVFHPEEGRIRLKMRIGDETALPKERWWHSKLRENAFSLREVAEMMRGVSFDEMRGMRKRIAEVARLISSTSDTHAAAHAVSTDSTASTTSTVPTSDAQNARNVSNVLNTSDSGAVSENSARSANSARSVRSASVDAKLRALFSDLKTGVPLLRMALRGDSLGEECMKKGLREVLREKLRDAVNKPLKISQFIVNKPWGYELWCASPRNTCVVDANGQQFKMKLEELAFLFESFGHEGRFPLIVKIIKADEPLSVQVHPDDEYARRIGDAFGKDEAWVVLESSRNARIFLGFNRDESEESFENAVRTGEILHHLNEFCVKEGDVFNIPAGTIHALGGGTKVYEISSASERTFRIYDYGRGRELHIKDAISVLKFSKSKELKKEPILLRREGENEEYLLIESEKFVLKKARIRDVMVFEEAKFSLVTCISGEVQIQTASGEISLRKGETAVVPPTRFEVRHAEEKGEERRKEKRGENAENGEHNSEHECSEVFLATPMR